MKKSVQKTASIVLCFLLLFSTAAFAFAGDPGENEPNNPRYVNIGAISCNLVISGINSTSEARLQANASMPLSIKMELQKLKDGSYTTVQTWTDSRTGTGLIMSETRLINIFATYRLKVTFTAGSETVVSYDYP